MAGDWIKMRVDLKDDPVVFMLADMLGVDEFSVVGRLHCFWAWADKHAVDGHVDGATTRIVDRVSATDGFAAAMQKVGWLVVDQSGISIPNFDRHNGESAKERGLKNARQARWRAGKSESVDGQASTQSSTKPTTREEKRREETHSEANASDADASAAEPESAKAALWRESVVVLKAGGCPESLCRSFMGKLVKDYTEATVREAVTAAISAQPADAREYLKATCQRLKGERKDPITVPSTDTGAEKFKAAMDERAATATKPPAAILALARKAVRSA